jgi:hypothetical protein
VLLGDAGLETNVETETSCPPCAASGGWTLARPLRGDNDIRRQPAISTVMNHYRPNLTHTQSSHFPAHLNAIGLAWVSGLANVSSEGPLFPVTVDFTSLTLRRTWDSGGDGVDQSICWRASFEIRA